MSIDHLKNKNPFKRDANISFQDKGHIYTIKHDGKSGNDTGFTSVTTFVHSFVEKFDADKIIDNMMRSARWPDNKYYGMTKPEIKKLWTDNGIEASGAGTKLHYDIECIYNEMSVTNDSVEYKYFLDFKNNYSNLTAYRTEMLVYHEELRISGSIDMLFQKEDGSLEIYDWKRSKEIVKVSKWNKWMNSPVISHLPDTNYWHYALQLNIYKAIVNEKYGMNVKDLYLVILHPNNRSYLRIHVVDLQDEVKQLFLERLEQLSTI